MQRSVEWGRKSRRHTRKLDDIAGARSDHRSEARAFHAYCNSHRSFHLRHPVRLKRRAFTLAELLVATAIAGIATALMTAAVVRHQRFYSAAGEILSTRSQLRDAADILASDIRSASVSMFGLPVMTDTAVEMLTVIATSVACSAPVGSTVGLPPSRLISGHTLTSMLAQPDTGDLALIYGASPSAPDSGAWESFRIASFSSRSLATSCPSSSGFTTPGDEFSGATGFQVSLTSTPSAAIRKGAPVYFLRRARYSYYRSSDGEWYLGYRRCNVASPFTCAAIQPVSGPYLGMTFRYYDLSGAQVNAPAESFRVARVEFVLRGKSTNAIALTGDARKIWRDSVVVTVSPRNRLR